MPGVTVKFCTDSTCVLLESDEGGTISFEGEPDFYHVQLLKAPDGYSFDAEFEMTTHDTYGEWALYIKMTRASGRMIAHPNEKRNESECFGHG